jgi:hypothetical protein
VNAIGRFRAAFNAFSLSLVVAFPFAAGDDSGDGDGRGDDDDEGVKSGRANSLPQCTNRISSNSNSNRVSADANVSVSVPGLDHAHESAVSAEVGPETNVLYLDWIARKIVINDSCTPTLSWNERSASGIDYTSGTSNSSH